MGTSRLRYRLPGDRSPEEVAEAIRKRVASNPEKALADARAKAKFARETKRQASRLRRTANIAQWEFNEFKKALESLGISVVIEPPLTTNPNQGQEAQVATSQTKDPPEDRPQAA